MLGTTYNMQGNGGQGNEEAGPTLSRGMAAGHILKSHSNTAPATSEVASHTRKPPQQKTTHCGVAKTGQQGGMLNYHLSSFLNLKKGFTKKQGSFQLLPFTS